MRGNMLLLGLALICGTSSYSQPVAVKGKVVLSTGYPVMGVTVRSKQERKEIYTDSTGHFDFQVSSFSTVALSLSGFEKVDIKVEDRPIDTVITLKPESASSYNGTDATSQVNNSSFSTAIGGAGPSAGGLYGSSFSPTSTMLPSFTHKEETKGSRYLLDRWASGTVTDLHDTVINMPSYRYNYDKINGLIIFTNDGQTAVEVDHSQAKSFTLTTDGRTQLFRYVPEIDKKLYVKVLAEGPKYSLFKLIKTKFIKSDYRTDGMTSTGNPYDEYEDETSYFLRNEKTHVISPVRFKQKVLKELVADDKERASKYLSEHRDEVIDEPFTTGLVEWINE